MVVDLGRTPDWLTVVVPRGEHEPSSRREEAAELRERSLLVGCEQQSVDTHQSVKAACDKSGVLERALPELCSSFDVHRPRALTRRINSRRSDVNTDQASTSRHCHPQAGAAASTTKVADHPSVFHLHLHGKALEFASADVTEWIDADGILIAEHPTPNPFSHP